jgi:hypothetical protein
MRGCAHHEEEEEMIQHYPNATQVSGLQRRGLRGAVLQGGQGHVRRRGPRKLARYPFGIAGKVADVMILERNVNGQPGLVVQQAGATVTVVAFTVTAGRITHIWAVRNPEKLRSWSTQGGCRSPTCGEIPAQVAER